MSAEQEYQTKLKRLVLEEIRATKIAFLVAQNREKVYSSIDVASLPALLASGDLSVTAQCAFNNDPDDITFTSTYGCIVLELRDRRSVLFYSQEYTDFAELLKKLLALHETEPSSGPPTTVPCRSSIHYTR